jgi:RHS repeat-associated protein
MKHTMNMKAYEMNNHLGNVLVTVSDARIPVNGTGGIVGGYAAIVKSATDYSAFGAPMAGRTYTNAAYRYGFNGKETDWESGLQDYGMRIYDKRLGRFLSVDPVTKEYPMLTPYQFASNTPVQAIDLDGLEMYYAPDGTLIGKVGTSTEVRFVDADFVSSTLAYINWANYTHNDECRSYANGKLNEHSHQASTTVDAAAEDWAFRYNTKSVESKKEYSSDIYEVKIGDKTYYNYTQPNEEGEAASSVSSPVPAGKKVVANVHSHANWTKQSVINGKDGNEDFSPYDMPAEAGGGHGDIYLYETRKINGYVATPGGKLLKYDYNTDKTTTLRTDLPADPAVPDSAKK